MRKQSWEIGGMYASHPKVIIHEVKNNNIDYLTFEILEDGIVTFTSSQETNILSWSFDNGSTWTEGNEIEVKKGDNVKCKGECVLQLDPYGYPLGIGQFSTTCHYNLSGNVATLLKITEKLAEEEIIDNIYAASCGAYTLESSSSGEIFFQTTYPNLSKKERVIALYLHSWEEIHEEFKTICTKTQESLLQESYNLAILMEEFILMIPNYAELTPEEFFITFAKMNVPDATDLDGIGVGLYFPLIFNEGSDELECEYYGLFAQNNKLIDASKLTIIPLSTSGCANMFTHCTSLKYPPKLPATTLTEGCYDNMFCECTSLTTAPDLPAITLTDSCYFEMFAGCISLTTAPTLPATTLANNCYEFMFQDCKKLVTAPALPATKLAEYCYQYMFKGCTSLVTAPELPATTLTIRCYNSMFQSCTSLTTAPTLPATTLAGYNCYQSMFEGCTSLTTAPELPATKLANSCYEFMFDGCTSLTTAPELPATTLKERCYNSMFQSCTSLVTAPELPATTLADWCYSNMFCNCTSLTTAPTLPATKLADWCYSNMFCNCISLNHIKMLATDISAFRCLDNWVYDVAKNGTFIKHVDATWDTKVIPTGWNVEYNFIPRKCKLTITADDVSGRATYTKIYYTAEVEGLLDTGEPHIAIFTGTDISKEFEKNMSTTEVVNRSIDYTYMGVTATTTIILDIYVDICDGYLTINALEDGLTAKLSRNTIEYCIDSDDNWVILAANTETPPINAGQTLSFRGHIIPNSTNGSGTFTINKQCNLTGNCNSLLFGDLAHKNYNLSTYTKAFYQLFLECTSIKNISSKFLPATTLGKYCYDSMFNGCTSLVTTPELPATTSVTNCYRLMFRNCTSLTTAPALPATTLTGYNCYHSMFAGCISLTTAPDLPATALADWCYFNMFENCISLTTAPDLPATTLADYCYSNMFENCTKLNYIKMLATDISASHCLVNWVNGVSSSGTFIKHPNTEIPTGISGIPEGWTVETIDI